MYYVPTEWATKYLDNLLEEGNRAEVERAEDHRRIQIYDEEDSRNVRYCGVSDGLNFPV